MWGEHMHHGFYPKGGPAKSNQQAQTDMIDESLKVRGRGSVSYTLHVLVYGTVAACSPRPVWAICRQRVRLEVPASPVLKCNPCTAHVCSAAPPGVLGFGLACILVAPF